MAISITSEPAGVLHSRNDIWLILGADAGWAALEDYRARLTIEYETTYLGGVWESLDSLTEYPLSSGVIAFNIQAAIEGILTYELPPWPVSNAAQIVSEGIRRVRLTIDEQYGVTDTPQSTQNLSMFQVIRGGFSAFIQQGLTAWRAANKFLTNQPQYKLATAVQPEWLYYLTDEGGTWDLHFQATDIEGELGSEVASGISLVTGTDNLVRFPAGYTQLGFDTASPQIESWEVWLVGPSGQTSERRSYALEQSSDLLARYFLFEGSLGGWHSLCTRGEATQEVNPIGIPSNRILRHDALATDTALGWANTRHTQSFSQASGYLPVDHAYWLAEIQVSEHVYRIGDGQVNREATGDLIPIRVDRNTVQVREDNDFLGRIEFDYQEGRTHQGF